MVVPGPIVINRVIYDPLKMAFNMGFCVFFSRYKSYKWSCVPLLVPPRRLPNLPIVI